jgi:hypothetical protein
MISPGIDIMAISFFDMDTKTWGKLINVKVYENKNIRYFTLAIIQLYRCENKLFFHEMMMTFT